jgi:hypothetical protein
VGDGGAAGGGGVYTAGPIVSGTSKPQVKSDIAETTLLSDLSASDAVKLCQAVVKAADTGFDATRSQTLSCYVFALSAATREDGSLDETLCELDFENCSAQAKAARAPTCEKASISKQFSTCGAAVGDLEDCIDQAAAELRDLLKGLTCTDASLNAVRKFVKSPEPAPCIAVGSACSSLDLARTSEMGLAPSPTGCDDNCPFARDGLCDDGGAGSKLKLCGLGTDCHDCGPRSAM